jgi:hypothetical protein
MLDFVLHLALALGLGPSPSDVEALRRTASEPVSAQAAADHLTAARAAAERYGVDANLLLAIADHESRYTDATTPEVGGRVSCGAMTPTPIARCAHDGILVDYLRGAEHLAGWIAAARGDLRGALLGYAGGYVLLRACAEGPVLRDRPGGQVDLCSTPDVFLRRARWIRREMSRPFLARVAW